LGWVAALRINFFKPIKEALGTAGIEESYLPPGKLGRALRENKLLESLPNIYARTINSIQKDDKGKAYYKRRILQLQELMPSTTTIDKKQLNNKLPVVSIVIDDGDLYHPVRGIISNYKSRGRDWERMGYFSYFENEKLIFATPVGIRLHGSMRKGRKPSFRLYFRKEYGDKYLSDSVFNQGDEKRYKRLVVRNDSFLPLTMSMSFDISKKIGAVVPAHKPAIFYLNGKLQGFYCLTEHLYKEQWEKDIKNNNIIFYRYKGPSDEESLSAYKEMEDWVKKCPAPLKMEDVEKKIDLDKYINHIFSIMFCGTTDWRQGIAVLEKNRKDAKWYWINWDMDHSFLEFRRRDINVWEKEAIDLLSAGKYLWKNPPTVIPYERRDVRSILFTRLMAEDPNFKKYFVKCTENIMSSKITKDYLLDRLNYYNEMASYAGFAEIQMKKLRRLLHLLKIELNLSNLILINE
jgi:hypothetical protein